MKIIALITNASGSRPPLQTWNEAYLPEGYAWCPEEFEEVFYSENPAGFVDIEVEGDTVTAMTINTAALEAYRAAHPAPVPETAEPTSEELLDILMGVAN